MANRKRRKAGLMDSIGGFFFGGVRASRKRRDAGGFFAMPGGKAKVRSGWHTGRAARESGMREFGAP